MEAPSPLTNPSTYQDAPPDLEDLKLVANMIRGNLMALGEAREHSADSAHQDSIEKYLTGVQPTLNTLKQLEQKLKTNMSPQNYPQQPPAPQQNYPQQPPMPQYPPQSPPGYPTNPIYPAYPPPQPQAMQPESVQLFSMIYNEIQKISGILNALTEEVRGNTEELKKLKKLEKTTRQPSTE